MSERESQVASHKSQESNPVAASSAGHDAPGATTVSSDAGPAPKAATGTQDSRLKTHSSRLRINFAKGNGLVPVIVQDHRTREVLMLGYANQEAVERTLKTGRLHFWSRSRQELWLKGEKSGNYLQIRRLRIDCDGDTLLAEVEPATGETPICHTGAETCFYESLEW